MIFKRLNRIFAADPHPEGMPGPIDYGDGLHRLPDPQPDTGLIFDVAMNKWVPIEDKAAETLAAYREGRWGAEGGRCPICSEVANLGNAVFLAANHPRSDARKRWAVAEAEHRLMIFALGDCLCGQKLAEQASVEQARAALAPYLGRMATGG